jgi:hypothetical protein
MSKLHEALEKADRDRKAKAQARELPRATVPPDGDTLATVARWIEEGPAFVDAFASLVAERDRFRARAEAAERECHRLREQARGRPWLGSLAHKPIAAMLAASIGIAAISGWAWLSGGRLWLGGERSALTRLVEGESTARSESSARIPAEPDGSRVGAVGKGTDGRGEFASTDPGTRGNLPRGLGDGPSAKRAKQSQERRRVLPPSSPEFTERSRVMTATDLAAPALYDPGAIADWLLKEGSRAGQ